MSSTTTFDILDSSSLCYCKLRTRRECGSRILSLNSWIRCLNCHSWWLVPSHLWPTAQRMDREPWKWWLECPSHLSHARPQHPGIKQCTFDSWVHGSCSISSAWPHHYLWYSRWHALWSWTVWLFGWSWTEPLRSHMVGCTSRSSWNKPWTSQCWAWSFWQHPLSMDPNSV